MPCERTPDEEKKSKGYRANEPRRRRRQSQRNQSLDRRPPNAWLRFRSTFNHRFPSAKTQQSSAASLEWKRMTGEAKEPYFRQATEEMAAWKARQQEADRLAPSQPGGDSGRRRRGRGPSRGSSGAQAGPRMSGRRSHRYRNANADMNAWLPTRRFSAHSDPTPSSSGLRSAVDPLVGPSDAATDWSVSASLGMGQPSIPPAGPSQYPNRYYGSRSASSSSNAFGLSGLPASISSDRYPANPLIGRWDSEIDRSAILNMSSLPDAGTSQVPDRQPPVPPAGPSQYQNRYGSREGEGLSSSNAIEHSGLLAHTSFGQHLAGPLNMPSLSDPGPSQVPNHYWSQYDSRSGSYSSIMNANAMGLSELIAPTSFLPAPHQHQHSQRGHNSAPSMPLGLGPDLGPFDSPTRTSGSSSHSITPPSDVNPNGNGDDAHAGQGPSLWDSRYSLDDLLSLVPPLEPAPGNMGNGNLWQEDSEEAREDNDDWRRFNFDFEG